MTPEALRTLSDRDAAALPPPGRALWHAAQGEWDAAHEIVQSIETPAGAAIHAYLHRQEGDVANARYWYRRAGKPPVSGHLEKEWATLVAALL